MRCKEQNYPSAQNCFDEVAEKARGVFHGFLRRSEYLTRNHYAATLTVTHALVSYRATQTLRCAIICQSETCLAVGNLCIVSFDIHEVRKRFRGVHQLWPMKNANDWIVARF